MTHVVTLMSPEPSAIDSTMLAELAYRLPQSAEPVWLSPGEAVDMAFVPGPDWDGNSAAQTIRARYAGRPVDVVVQPIAARRKSLLLADMDSTMIGQECIDELADFVGRKAEVAAITERTMRGELAFDPSLRARVALLEGLDVSVVDQVIAQRITVTPGAPELVRTMRASGAYAALVSGGFTLFTHVVGARIGFDENRANVLVVRDGKLTGTVTEPILGREAKAEALLALRKARELGQEDTLAVGDGANDLAMIAAAGLGVAFHAKPAVAAAATARIDHCDLTALLFAQGYRREDFVST